MREADRRRRREFIQANHPDRGGDLDVFVSGLRAFDAELEPDHPEQLPPVIVVRHRVWLLKLANAVMTRLRPEGRPPRVR